MYIPKLRIGGREVTALTELIIKNDCLCEGYKHELSKYPRSGLIERKLCSGDKVIFITEFNNFYGSFWRVEKVGDHYKYDVKADNLKFPD